MKIEFNRKKLLTALNKADKFTDKLNSSVKFVLSSDGVATLYSYSATASFKASIETESCDSVGEFVISNGIIKQLLPKLNEDKVSIEVKKTCAIISTEGSNYKIPIFNSSTWLSPAAYKDKKVSSLILSDLIDALDFGKICATSHPTYPLYLNSVLLEIKDNALIAQSTDGKSLAYSEKKGVINETSEELLSFPVPLTTLKALIDTFADLEGQTEIQIYMGNNNQLLFYAVEANIEVALRLADAKFPNIQKVLDGLSDIVTSKFDKKQLFNALDRVNILTRDFMKQSLLMLGKEGLIIKSMNGGNYDYGMGVEDVTYYSSPSGETCYIVLNSESVLTALKCLNDDVITLSITSGGMGVITNSDKSKMFVVAQISLRDDEIEPALDGFVSGLKHYMVDDGIEENAPLPDNPIDTEAQQEEAPQNEAVAYPVIEEDETATPQKSDDNDFISGLMDEYQKISEEDMRNRQIGDDFVF